MRVVPTGLHLSGPLFSTQNLRWNSHTGEQKNEMKVGNQHRECLNARSLPSFSLHNGRLLNSLAHKGHDVRFGAERWWIWLSPDATSEVVKIFLTAGRATVL